MAAKSTFFKIETNEGFTGISVIIPKILVCGQKVFVPYNIDISHDISCYRVPIYIKFYAMIDGNEA